MPSTNIRGAQVLDGTIARADLNTSTVGQAVVTKIVQGTNITLSSTGADSGTGDVTISCPSGGTGPAGANSWTLTAAGFTIPNVGSTAVLTVNDTSWATVGEYVWVQSSPTVSDSLQITAKTPTTLTLLNPPTAGMQASGDAGNLLQIGSDSLLYLPPSQIQPVIWSQTRRMFSSVGNPNMEIDQRNVGIAFASTPANAGWSCDRWWNWLTGTMRCSSQQISTNVVVPGTNYLITQKILRITLTTAQATLGATDVLGIGQVIEGPMLRELINDVHSVSLLVRSSVANLKFGLALQDGAAPSTRGLGKLCSLGAANTWTLFSLANLPVFPVAGTFPLTPGSVGYQLEIMLAAGSSWMLPANDTWQTGNLVGAVGQSNFAASPVNSTFDVAFCQHEPGATCTTLIDKPLAQNYDECLRYYSKSVNYAQLASTATWNGGAFTAVTTSQANGYLPYPKRMAKVPTITMYGPNGTLNFSGDMGTGAMIGITGAGNISEAGINQISSSAAFTIGHVYSANYVADSGW